MQREHAQQGMQSGAAQYVRFGAMIVTSTAVMFALTYTNAYSADHVRYSEERLYMALLMGSAMAVVMMGFMWGMHRDKRVNAAIIGGALLIGLVALWLSRSQHFVDDQSYMRAMIPHHSIAILTSERADIDDVRVRDLADGIAATQRREIAEMDWLINDISEHGKAKTEQQAQERPVPDFSGEE
jgi:hypothetical protein